MYSGITRNGKRWVRHNGFQCKARVPGTRVALLSRPEKMPGPSWSLPAGRKGGACPFAVYGKNAICETCYADSGRYAHPVVANAQRARFAWAARCMRTPEGVEEFVSTMVAAFATIRRPDWLYVRVHDSGDLFSERYTRAWIRICAALPHMRFWFPTRSWRAPWILAIVELNALANVTVRPSALYFDDDPPIVAGLAAGTTVKAVGFTCPAPFQDDTCASCRHCWDDPTSTTAYHEITESDRRKHRPVDAAAFAGSLVIVADRGRVTRTPTAVL